LQSVYDRIQTLKDEDAVITKRKRIILTDIV